MDNVFRIKEKIIYQVKLMDGKCSKDAVLYLHGCNRHLLLPGQARWLKLYVQQGGGARALSD